MLEQYHTKGKVVWPDGNRLAVILTVDFQGGEDVKPDRNGKLNHEEWTQGEYGPHTGIWRLLRVLEKENVKATFLTCGAIAERFPEAVKTIVQKGHEIAGHGYHHEIARDLSREEEKEVIQRAAAMIEERTGQRPVGWRSCTQSPNSLELLMEQGFLWNSNSFSHDLPFIWVKGDRTLVEVPRQPFGDGRLYGHRDSGNPADTLLVWKSVFDELYEESSERPGFCCFQFHCYISGRPGRARALRALIQHMKSHAGVWFATGSEVARWWLREGVSTESGERPARALAAAGS